MPLLKIEKLNKIFPNGYHALKDVSFEVDKGDFLVIIGLSGSGKSTLLRCINRLYEPTSGRVLFLGEDLTKLSGLKLRAMRAKIAMIFQQFNLIPRLSVLHNVLSGALNKKSVLDGLFYRYTPEQKKVALEKIELVGLSHRTYQRADKLSGGQQQRVAIARALMQEPLLLLADEPVSSLDPATSHSIMKYLEQINKELGVTVICNLHFLDLVRRYASRVIALKDGQIIFEGYPRDITDEWFKKIYGEDAIEVKTT
ncbi:MAG: phosphonate ABC transporter ATP-binding protein [Cytophagaceae bacterium]|nr:phosphonate ABC transporter ATP-binding protein [Cytophagaceae bacterium]MDW8456438.1 phosphonate ABC transporter ATP-binding protein [Cytophagaceae bacterium]